VNKFDFKISFFFIVVTMVLPISTNFINLLVNDDIYNLKNLFLLPNWHVNIDFSCVFGGIKDINNTSSYNMLGSMYCKGNGGRTK